LKAIAGFSTDEIADDMNNKDDVHRWIAGIAARYDMGPAYIAAQFQYGQNLGTWRIAAGLGDVSYKVDMSGTTDNSAIVDFFNSHIKLSSNTMVVPEAGYFDAQEDGFGEPQHQTTYVGA
jgi:hypothetical protein